jgi:hypothetical protein
MSDVEITFPGDDEPIVTPDPAKAPGDSRENPDMPDRGDIPTDPPPDAPDGEPGELPPDDVPNQPEPPQ